MKLLLTITLLFFFYSLSFAQDKRVLVHGITYSNNLGIENVHVFNFNTNFGDVTDIDGNFEIKIKKGDVVKLSHIEYQSEKITITNKMIDDGITITLNRVINRLNKVIIKNHNLSGNLFLDNENTINYKINQKHNIINEIISLAKLPSKYDHITRLESEYINDVNPIKMNGGIGFGIPIRDKESELRIELREKKSIPTQIIHELGKNYFIRELKISEDKIYNFLTYCDYRHIYELYKNKKNIRLLEILKIESVSFLRKNK